MTPFGPWRPDATGHNDGFLKTLENAVPIPGGGYRSIRAFDGVQARGGPNTGLKNRGWGVVVNGDSYYLHQQANVTTNDPELYRQSTDAAPTEIYQASLTWIPDEVAGLVVTSATHKFAPVVFDDLLCIFGRLATPQKYTLTDLVNAVPNTTDLGGSPPAAVHAAKVRQQLVIGGTYESSVFYAERLWWSAFGDPESWTAGTNQAGFEDAALTGQGKITGIVGGDYGLVFQEHDVTRIDYIGSPDIWSFNTIEASYGNVVGPEPVPVGSDVYYLSSGGFRVIRDGTRSESIGKGKIDNWFFEQLGTTSSWPLQTEVWTSAYDPAANTVWWMAPLSVSLGVITVGYQIESGEWFRLVDSNITALKNPTLVTPAQRISRASPNTTDYANDTVLVLMSDGTANFDFLKPSGDKMAATFETTDQFNPGTYTYLSRARALIDGPYTLDLYEKADELADTESQVVTARARNDQNWVDLDDEVFSFRVGFTTTGDWEKATGYVIDAVPAGEY